MNIPINGVKVLLGGIYEIKGKALLFLYGIVLALIIIGQEFIPEV